jgi:hypothetical protein
VRVTLFQQRSEERLIIETLRKAKGAKVQPQRARVTLLGISSQGSQDRLIGIESHLRGAIVGDAGPRPWRFLNRSSSSNAFPDKPSLQNEGCRPPSPFMQDHGDHLKPKRKREVTPEVSRRRRFRVGGHPCTKRPEDSEGTRLEVYQMGDVVG